MPEDQDLGATSLPTPHTLAQLSLAVSPPSLRALWRGWGWGSGENLLCRHLSELMKTERKLLLL